MNPRVRGLIKLCILFAIAGALFFFFPKANAFVEMASRELRYFWWLILLVVLALWLIFGIGRKPKA